VSSTGVCVIRVDVETGALELVPGSPFAPGNPFFGVVAHPSGHSIYTLSRGKVWSFNVDPVVGTLSLLEPTLPFDTGGLGAIAMTPSGRFLYALSETSVAAFSVDPASGSLRAVPGSPFPSDARDSQGAVGVDPSGRFLVITHRSDVLMGVTVLSINGDTGALLPATRVLTPAGLLPGRVAFTPSGKFLYVLSYESDAGLGSEVWGFALGPTGELSLLPGTPLPTRPGASSRSFPKAVAVTPTGNYLLVTNDTLPSAFVSAFRIDPSTGTLTAVSGSPFSVAITSAEDLLIDPSGRYAYISSEFTENAVKAFAIDPTTGSVRRDPVSTIGLPNQPFYLAMSP
jgi:6-phosphogluconolactonase (cycloisomerase 2 family)